jgi:serine/threonine-protein kinase
MDSSSTWIGRGQEPGQPGDDLIEFKIDERYLVKRKLGQGGVGAVYLAYDTKLHDKPVVIKILLEKSEHDQWVVQKFLQEKEALARVDHPGVVGILDAGELPNGKPYLVMQFIEGIALRSAIGNTPEGMDLQRVSSIVKQIGSALSAVHSKGVFHRDLKPENIMLQQLERGFEQVKIVDFGIAKIKQSVIAPSTLTGAATAGTIVYMSPEQLLGLKVSSSSDIYAFGVITYEMVTGRRPFVPTTIAHLADLQRQGVRARPAVLRPQLAVEAEAAILKALAFEPAERFDDAADFAEALARGLLNEPERLKLRPGQLDLTVVESFTAAPAQTERPKHERQSRWPKIAVAGAVVVLLLLSVGFIAAMLGSRWLRVPETNEGLNRPALTRQRLLTYSLTVQKMRDNRPYQAPFQSSGQEIFESGYRFRFNMSSPQSGFLYVFNQSVDENSGRLIVFSSIYPTPKTNGGSAWIESNSEVQTSWNEFGGRPDTERFWIIWSNSEITELEAAKTVAFSSEEGLITETATNNSLKQFLSRHSEPQPLTVKDTVTRQTEVSAPGALLVKLLELEHR